jgi:hypothetical protein
MKIQLCRSALAAVSLATLPLAAHAQAVLQTHLGTSALDQFGSAAANAGDVDHDGYDDVIVGAPFAMSSGARRGAAYVYNGRTGAFYRAWYGFAANDQFGWAVDTAGDWDLDGWDDVIIGAPGYDAAGVDRGSAYVFSGKTGQVLAFVQSTQDNAQLGYAVAGGGDVDGDGRVEALVGSPGYDLASKDNVGNVYMVKSTTNSVFGNWTWSDPGAQYGAAVAFAGDMNHDGHDDVAIGGPHYSSSTKASMGRVKVIDADQNQIFYDRTGSNANDCFGYSLEGTGDLDGDGYGELLIGVPFAANGDGAVKLIDGQTQTIKFNLQGAVGGHLGRSVACVGDVDGDSIADFAAGEPEYYLLGAGADHGRIRVWSGVNGASLFSVLGKDGSHCGSSVAGIGDVNNDGRYEVVVGSRGDDTNGAYAGKVEIRLGDAPAPTSYCTGKANSLGCTPKIGFAGVASRTIGPMFHITCSDVRNNKSGILVWGFTQASTPFGGGTLCVGTPLQRTLAQHSDGSPSGADCTGSYDFAFSKTYMLLKALTPGMTIRSQYWMRDPGFAAPNNIGLSNALSFEVLP